MKSEKGLVNVVLLGKGSERTPDISPPQVLPSSQFGHEIQVYKEGGQEVQLTKQTWLRCILPFIFSAAVFFVMWSDKISRTSEKKNHLLAPRFQPSLARDSGEISISQV